MRNETEFIKCSKKRYLTALEIYLISNEPSYNSNKF